MLGLGTISKDMQIIPKTGLPMEVFSPEICYIANPYFNGFMSNKDGTLTDLDFLHSYQLVIVDCSNEHWGSFAGTIGKIHRELSRIDINFIILSHCPEDHDPDQGILFYPYWYYAAIKDKLFEVLPVTNKKRFALGCLNANPRPHRIANYFMFQNKKYWSNCCTTFFSTDPMPSRSDDVTLEPNEIEFWNSTKSKLPNKITDGFMATDLLPVTESYVHLVTETTVRERVFVTEKTWKPISAGQLFLVFGNPGTMDFLQSQGVDIFSDLIDHKYYDLEPDWRTRLVKLHQLLDDLVEQDLEAMNRATQQRRQNNAEKFFLGQFDLGYRSALLNKIVLGMQSKTNQVGLS